MSIAENIAAVRSRIEQAATHAGRNPQDIQLMAVSKTFPAAAIREAFEAGLRVFGENRVQEFAGKLEALRDLPGAEWHLIGHLQTNKASKAAELFSAIDSVDSAKLAEKLNSAAEKLQKRLPVLIEVNVGDEQQKTGVRAEAGEFLELLDSFGELRNLVVTGLMTIPPYTQDPEGARPYFKTLRQLASQIASRELPGINMNVLSMGMSHDFEVAIEEGSTCVRVGSAIFGERSMQR
jgi:PLP dependent protein